jgi:hypothetical protein
MLSCASLKGVVALSHAPQLSVDCPREATTRKSELGTRDFTRGILLRRYIQKGYPVACTWLCVLLASRFLHGIRVLLDPSWTEIVGVNP